MNEALVTLQEHGYLALFAVVLVDQLGIPVPSLLLLMGAGALVGSGNLGLIPVILLITLASMLGDFVWYEIGRRRGSRVLETLCRVSLEPDICVRKTEQTFEKYGLSCLLFAKFVPGLYTVTPPLAGMLRIPLWRFLLFDLGGILIWSAVYVGLGYALTDQLEAAVRTLTDMGSTMGQILLAILGIYLFSKFVTRQLYLQRLRTARVTPEQVKVLMDGDHKPYIVDLRHRSDIKNNPQVIPGAVVIPAEELESRHRELPRDTELILYCT